MPPKVKFQREEIVQTAFDVVRKKGLDALTAREVAAALQVSTRPIFTWFDSMDQLRAEVRLLAEARYRESIEEGLAESIPFLGVWKQYLRFAREEPALYRLLFLTPPGSDSGGAVEALRFSQELARESLMRVYRLEASEADSYFRDLWLVAYSFATLIVTGNCPWTEEEIFAIGAEISLSVCKAYKEIPGLSAGKYDRDAVFTELVAKTAVSEQEETERLRLYPASRTRMEAMIAAETDPELKKAYTEMLKGCLGQPDRWGWYAAWIIERKDGTPVGDLCFKGLSAEGIAEIGYGIYDSFQRRGYATEALQGALRWAFRHPEVTAIEAETAPDNAASRRVLEKCGFLPNGVMGEEGPRFSLPRERAAELLKEV